MASPPKPWEQGGSGTGATAAAAGTTAAAPALPAKPTGLSSVVNQNASAYSPYGSSPYGSTYGTMGGMGGMGSMGGYGSYSSPYSRFGGMGGMGYGGGYGSMYGGMGYGGMGGMAGMGPYGQNANSLTNTFNQSTAATFQIIEGVVSAFGGFAQMLESTYMATHSSFFAMISVAEQFSSLRDTLGSVLGIFTIMRWIRTLLAKITGRPPPADATSLTPAAFAQFSGQPVHLPDGSPAPAKPSKKPLFFFALAAFGLPYIMNKLIRALARSQEERAKQQGMIIGPDGQWRPAETTDPSKLEFCRLMYDYTPESATHGGQLQPGVDLEVKKGDFVAVLSKLDPMGQPSDWWKCRTRDGRQGYLPSPYLEVIKRSGDQAKMLTQKEEGMGSPIHSRAQTMHSTGRAQTMTSMSSEGTKVPVKGPEIHSKPGDISAESFQKSQFYS